MGADKGEEKNVHDEVLQKNVFRLQSKEGYIKI